MMFGFYELSFLQSNNIGAKEAEILWKKNSLLKLSILYSVSNLYTCLKIVELTP